LNSKKATGLRNADILELLKMIEITAGSSSSSLVGLRDNDVKLRATTSCRKLCKCHALTCAAEAGFSFLMKLSNFSIYTNNHYRDEVSLSFTI